MKIHALLQEFAREIGCPELVLDYTGTCAVEFPDDVHVDLHYEPLAEALCLAVNVLDLPDAQAPVVAALLRANLDLGALAGAWFALRGRTVSLCRSLPVDSLTAGELVDELSGLIARRRQWRTQLAASTQAALA